MRAERNARERGFTLLEVMIAIVITAIVLFGVTGATLGAMHGEANDDIRASLDDDALAVLSDIRMITAYDANTIVKLAQKRASMTRTLPSGGTETITVSVAAAAGSPPQEFATATATSGGFTATERVELFQHAPAPGSTVNQ